MPDSHRVISREYPDDRRIIVVVEDTDTPDRKSDDEILNAIEKWGRERQLRAVEDPE
jgi:hypothetical protein